MDVLDFKKLKKIFILIFNFNERIKKQKLFILIKIIRKIKKESVFMNLILFNVHLKLKLNQFFRERERERHIDFSSLSSLNQGNFLLK
jgi:hypothetical protein